MNIPLPDKRMIDRRGQTYGRLTVIEYSHSTAQGGPEWVCHCDCGKQVVIRGKDLRRNHTRSCGCLASEIRSVTHKTHGMSDTVEHNIWIGIKTRCYNPNAAIYRHYGGRGIGMCDRWKSSFENFYADMGPRPSSQYSIERVDNDGLYSPDNCQWATDTNQMNNTRSNHYITYQGKTQSISEWAKELDIPYGRLRARVLRGMPIDVAFSTKEFGYPRYHKKSRA